MSHRSPKVVASLALAAAAVALVVSTPARAAVVQTFDFSPGTGSLAPSDTTYQTFFDSNAAGPSVIKLGSPVLGFTTFLGSNSNTAADPANPGAESGWAGLHDGAASTKAWGGSANPIASNTFVTANGSGATWNFNTPQDITTIKVINGWGDTSLFSNQNWTVYINGVLLNTVAYNPMTDNNANGAGYNSGGASGKNPTSSMATLTDSSGKLATNVTSLQILWNTSATAQVVREVIVNGSDTPVVPAAGVTAVGVASHGAATGYQQAFDSKITTTDLINQGTSTFLFQTNTGTTSNGGSGGGTFDKLNDGIASSKISGNDLSGDTFFGSGDLAGKPTTTFHLNTRTNKNGYDLQKVLSITGWADTGTFSDQAYTVYVRQVGGTAFVPVKAVDYAPFAANGTDQHSAMVSIANAGGTLGTNIDAVRFVFTSSPTAQNGQVYRELEAQGTTSAAATAFKNLGVIMPLGDSITYGDDGTGNTNATTPGGYRTQLFSNLNSHKYAIQFGGTQVNNASAALATAGQENNEGHNGYRIDQIAANLDGDNGLGGNNGGHWLNGTGARPALVPDIILLHVGTNDILQGANLATVDARLDSLLAQIFADRPGVEVFIAGIIPAGADSNGARNQLVRAYNQDILNTYVPKYQALGDSIHFVDMYSLFTNNDGSINTSLFADAGVVHPSLPGYGLMGDAWANAIEAAHPVPEPASLSLLAAGAMGLLLRRRR